LCFFIGITAYSGQENIQSETHAQLLNCFRGATETANGHGVHLFYNHDGTTSSATILTEEGFYSIDRSNVYFTNKVAHEHYGVFWDYPFTSNLDDVNEIEDGMYLSADRFGTVYRKRLPVFYLYSISRIIIHDPIQQDVAKMPHAIISHDDKIENLGNVSKIIDLFITEAKTTLQHTIDHMLSFIPGSNADIFLDMVVEGLCSCDKLLPTETENARISIAEKIEGLEPEMLMCKDQLIALKSTAESFLRQASLEGSAFNQTDPAIMIEGDASIMKRRNRLHIELRDANAKEGQAI